MRYNLWVIYDYTLADSSGYSSSNVYRIEAADLDAAKVIAHQVCVYTLSGLSDRVFLSRYRLRTDDEGVGDGYFSGGFGRGHVSSLGVGIVDARWSMMVPFLSGNRVVGRKHFRFGWTKFELEPGGTIYFSRAALAYDLTSYVAGSGVFYNKADVLIDGWREDRRLRGYKLRHGTHRRELLVI